MIKKESTKQLNKNTCVLCENIYESTLSELNIYIYIYIYIYISKRRSKQSKKIKLIVHCIDETVLLVLQG